MKAMQRIKRVTAWGLSALTLSAVLLCAVACTGGGDPAPGGTTGGTTAATTPATSRPDTGTNRPLDPGAGTVTPNGDAGDPPAGTDSGNTPRAYRSHSMH